MYSKGVLNKGGVQNVVRLWKGLQAMGAMSVGRVFEVPCTSGIGQRCLSIRGMCWLVKWGMIGTRGTMESSSMPGCDAGTSDHELAFWCRVAVVATLVSEPTACAILNSQR